MRWLFFLMLATPAAAICPEAPGIDDAEAAVLSQMLDARGEMEASTLNARLWLLWLTAPDAKAQALLDGAIAQRRMGALREARVLLTELVEYCPDYAEGHNQLGFVAFLRRDFETALVHVDRALDIRPTHLGALSGKVVTLIGAGRDAEAQEVLRRALRLNPWLPERRFLTEPPGQPL